MSLILMMLVASSDVEPTVRVVWIIYAYILGATYDIAILRRLFQC